MTLKLGMTLAHQLTNLELDFSRSILTYAAFSHIYFDHVGLQMKLPARPGLYSVEITIWSFPMAPRFGLSMTLRCLIPSKKTRVLRLISAL